MADSTLQGLPNKSSPIGNDLSYIADSASSNASKNVKLSDAITKAHGLADGVPYVSSSTMTSDSTKLGFDSTNTRLGIGASTIPSKLSVGYDANWIVATAGAPTATPSASGGAIGTGTYYYVVSAFNILGQAAQGTESAAVSVTGPTGSVSLTWTAVPGAIGYNIYRTTTSGVYTSPALIANVYGTSFVDTLTTPTSGAPASDSQVGYASSSQTYDVFGNAPANNSAQVSHVFETINAPTVDSTNVRLGAQFYLKQPSTSTNKSTGALRALSATVHNASNFQTGVVQGFTAVALQQTTYATPGSITAIIANAFSYSGSGVTTNAVLGFSNSVQNNGAGTVTSMIGNGINVINTSAGGGIATNIYGILSTATDQTSNNNTGIYGASFTSTRTGSGTTTNQYGVNISLTNSGTGTITNRYGLYIAGTNSGTLTNTAYDVYASTSNAYNYFAGKTGIGVTAPIAKLHTTGFAAAISTKTADYTADPSVDYTLNGDATSGAITFTLPAAASSSGVIFNFKKIDSSGNTVTIDANASETIDGALTKVLSTQYSSVTIQCNGSNWFIY